MVKYLYGFRDRDGDHIFLDQKDAIYILVLSEDFPRDFPTEGVRNIAILQWDRGSGGTITSPENYDKFANLCSIYIESSRGCSHWIIGNEPNSRDSWPDGKKISPQDYATCFRLCRYAIHSVRPEDKVLVAAVAPINFEEGSWTEYLGEILCHLGGELDGIAFHGDIKDSDFLLPPFVVGDVVEPPAASPSPLSEELSGDEKMKQAEYLREDEVIRALRSALGNIAIAAKDLGLTRGQLQDYIVNHPAVREEKHQIKESVKDDAEDQLVTRMQTNDNLLMFFLRTQARDRGYEPKVPLVGADGKSLSVSVDARSLISAMRQGLMLESNGEEDSDETSETANSSSNGA